MIDDDDDGGGGGGGDGDDHYGLNVFCQELFASLESIHSSILAAWLRSLFMFSLVRACSRLYLEGGCCDAGFAFDWRFRPCLRPPLSGGGPGGALGNLNKDSWVEAGALSLV